MEDESVDIPSTLITDDMRKALESKLVTNEPATSIFYCVVEQLLLGFIEIQESAYCTN